MPVVRGRGQKQPVLTSLGKLPRRDRALTVHRVAVAATGRGRARRRDMVRLVDHKHVERESAGIVELPDLAVHGPQQPLGARCRQPRHRDDHPREQPERVRVQTMAAPHCSHQLPVDDHELQPELLPHLVLPLQRQTRRADDDHRPGSMPQQQLLDHQPGLDGFAEPDVVGQQQVRPRRLQGPAQRL